jgi:hypothetical protein
MTSPNSPISEFTSHIDGRNATVRIYPDRVAQKVTGRPG